VRIAGVCKRLQQAIVAIIGEWALARRYAIAIAAVLQQDPVRLSLRRTAAFASEDGREILQTIPGARTYVIDSCGRYDQSIWPARINELRFGMAGLSPMVSHHLTE